MILQRYVLKQLIAAFVLSYSAIVAVCVVASVFQLLRVFEGVGLVLLGKMMPVTLAYISPWALLVGAASATTAVYGRLSSDNELDAMKMCGIPPGSILAPVALFGVLLGGAAYALNEHAAPAATRARRTAFRESTLFILAQPPAGAQRFVLGTLRLSYMDCRDGRIERPYLMKFDRDRIESEYHALSGIVRIGPTGPPALVLSNPSAVVYQPSGATSRITIEGDFAVPLDLAGERDRPEDAEPDELGLWDLLELLPDQAQPGRKTQIQLAIHTRVAQSCAPLLLVLVAAPVGAFVRRGSKLAGFGAALPLLLAYLVLFFVFQGVGRRGAIPPVVAAFLPDLILLGTAALLLRTAGRT